MATSGIKFELTEKDKKHAIKYVEESGFFKNRLANFLDISRPTLDKILDEDTTFFTDIKHADAIFCKDLIKIVQKKNPVFILNTKYREEFNNTLKVGFDPEVAIQEVKKLLEENTTTDLPPLT